VRTKYAESVKNISYIYDAVGTKLKKVVTDASSLITTEYAENYVYEGGVLQFFNTAEGYVEPKGLGWEYVFQYKDHLGNIRLSYADSNGDGVISPFGGTQGGEIREENNFYPFGLKHKGYNNVVTSTNPALKFKYNGVEYEESLGMNLYQMDVRSYDPDIARFTSLDPVTHFSQSTYTAFDNNPVFWADPSGADSQTIYDFNGNAYTVDCNSGECDNAKKQTQETVGADGLTNEQWVELSRNGGLDAINNQRKNNSLEFSALKRSENRKEKAIKIVKAFIENLFKWAYFLALVDLASEDEASRLRSIKNMEKLISVSFPEDAVRLRSEALKRSVLESMAQNRDYGSIIFGENYSVENIIIDNAIGDYGFIYKSGGNVFYQNLGYPEHSGQGLMDNTFANYIGVIFRDTNGKQVGGLFFKSKKLYDDFVKYFNETLVEKFKEELSKGRNNEN